MKKEIIIKSDGRIDEVLAKEINVSRNIAKTIIKNGILINNKETSKPAYIVKANDKVVYEPLEEEKNDSIIPNPHIKIDVVYEDEYLMVINKPRGLVIHMAPGHKEDTLVNYLITLDDKFIFDEETMKGGRPGIVHRLDKDTSGLLIVAKTSMAEEELQKDIKYHKVDRRYLAICYGNVNEDKFTIDVPLKKPNHTIHKAMPDIKGLKAITHFTKIWSDDKYSLVECQLETGRTHQIRAHLAYIDHPIVGDPLYCKYKDKRFLQGQLLVAYKLIFKHPITKKEMTFEIKPDKYFSNAENILKEEN